MSETILNQYKQAINFEGEFTPFETPRTDPNFSRTVNEGLDVLLKNYDLQIDGKTKPSLCIQSLGGQVMEGHSVFRRSPNFYRHATNYDVLAASRLSTEDVLKVRQGHVDRAVKFYHDLLDIRSGKTMQIRRRSAPMDAHFLAGMSVKYGEQRKNVLKGAVIAGLMDSAEYREKARVAYKDATDWDLEIGYGTCLPVNTQKMREFGITLKMLASYEHSDEALNFLNQLGVLEREISEIGPNAEMGYVRLRKGLGTCDDLALSRIGERYGVASMLLGGFPVDAIDTYDKMIPGFVESGSDEKLARDLQEEWKRRHGEQLATEEEIIDVILHAAKALPAGQMIRHSSSHRTFVQSVGNGSKKVPVIKAHAEFIDKGRKRSFTVRSGPNKITSRCLYENFQQRRSHLRTVMRRVA